MAYCFTKDGTPYNIPFKYQDARESISVCLERYEASKQLQHILPNLPSLMLYQTTEEKYFTLQMMNSATNQLEPYKICVAFFKENRLMRIRSFGIFARTGPGAGQSLSRKSQLAYLRLLWIRQKSQETVDDRRELTTGEKVAALSGASAISLIR
ncbi:hypothetical protein J4734_26240 [Klebsiella pneumoniae]|uniref:Uncharacterized protein n=1 Tax=Klebsiella pneumoniae TaxID=573 RepID=A0A939SQG8_KLEPN|nr:hypothetical protein [Klebsiella pneumoniae]